MSQRAIFTKETIIEATFQLTRELGWGAVSSRTIARRLGSSTMPIYSTTRSMSELEREVRRRTEAMLLDYQRKPATDDIALNKAIGYVVFAREEKNLFRFLYVDRTVRERTIGGGASSAATTPTAGANASDTGAVTGDGAADAACENERPLPTLEELTSGEALPTLEEQAQVAMRDPRILKSWIFTHGLASMIASGVIDLSDEVVGSLLQEAGAALVQSAK